MEALTFWMNLAKLILRNDEEEWKAREGGTAVRDAWLQSGSGVLKFMWTTTTRGGQGYEAAGLQCVAWKLSLRVQKRKRKRTRT